MLELLCVSSVQMHIDKGPRCMGSASLLLFLGKWAFFLLAQGKLNRYLLSYSFVVSLKILRCLLLFGPHTLHWPRPHLPVCHAGVTCPSSAPPQE